MRPPAPLPALAVLLLGLALAPVPPSTRLSPGGAASAEGWLEDTPEARQGRADFRWLVGAEGRFPGENGEAAWFMVRRRLETDHDGERHVRWLPGGDAPPPRGVVLEACVGEGFSDPPGSAVTWWRVEEVGGGARVIRMQASRRRCRVLGTPLVASPWTRGFGGPPPPPKEERPAWIRWIFGRRDPAGGEEPEIPPVVTAEEATLPPPVRDALFLAVRSAAMAVPGGPPGSPGNGVEEFSWFGQARWDPPLRWYRFRSEGLPDAVGGRDPGGSIAGDPADHRCLAALRFLRDGLSGVEFRPCRPGPRDLSWAARELGGVSTVEEYRAALFALWTALGFDP